MLERAEWISLDGAWQFAIDAEGLTEDPAAIHWDREIRVPFAPETKASGIRDTSLFRACWYRRAVPAPAVPLDHRLLLHFGAVDYRATVWANGQLVGRHEGGYTPFTCDLTGLAAGGVIDLVVRAEDDPTDLAKPRGKQDWLADPHSIWYERTTGIWQTVWMEVVPTRWIESIRWTPNLERWELACAVRIAGHNSDGMRLAVTLKCRDQLLAADEYGVIGGEVHRRIALSDPGIDDYRNTLLWNPARPTIIEAEIRLLSQDGRLVDSVRSYTALRAVAVDGDRFVLNGRPYELRLVLDQGYWPDTGLTAPDDAAFVRDIELTKAMGFNGVRKHQKIEDPRYLYWADRMGLLVWEEMPSAYRFTQESIDRTTREWMAVLARDHSHPCIVAWVPFNESWGVPNLPQNAAERHYVRGLYHLTKTYDVTRPVIGNDGWESVATDMIGIHDYESDPERLSRRYHTPDREPLFPRRERPGGRLLVLEGERTPSEPIVLSEFGGITFSRDVKHTWGYSRAPTPAGLARRYAALLEAVRSIALFAGFCYTQFADTYQEANGLLYADRRPKVPLSSISAATMGYRRRRTRERKS